MYKKNCKDIPPCFLISNSIPTPSPSPILPTCKEKLVCNDVCGNILLNDQVLISKIWIKEFLGEVIVTASIFNSATSDAPMKVTIIQGNNNSIVYNVPIGNTLSLTVDNTDTIIVSKSGEGTIHGTYCLKLCFSYKFTTNKVSESKYYVN